MVRVRHTAVHRTDFNALGLLVPADTLGALVRINYVDCLAFLDSLILAVWLTGAATDTLVGNFICHLRHLLNYLDPRNSFFLSATATHSGTKTLTSPPP